MCAGNKSRRRCAFVAGMRAANKMLQFIVLLHREGTNFVGNVAYIFSSGAPGGWAVLVRFSCTSVQRTIPVAEDRS